MANTIYHPVYNPHGTMKASDDKFWYETTVSITSLYDCILPANVGTVNGRPDGKKSDTIYSGGSGGIVGVGTYTTDDINLDIESTKLLSDSGLEAGTEYVGLGVNQAVNSLLTSGGNLSVEVIGTETTLPQDWKNRLSSVKAIPISMTEAPDGTKTTFKLSRKVTTINQVLQSSDSGATWSIVAPAFDTIANTATFSTAPAVGDLIIFSPTIRNKPLHVSNQLPIEVVSHKAIATNSHSVYKGVMVSNAITNKISVGNGSNGLESRTLENAELDENNVLQTIPQHNTIALDIENSPASKYFTSLAVDDNNEYVIQVTGKELAYNSATTSYDGDTPDFTQLTNGTEIDTNGVTVNTANVVKRLGVFKG